MKSSAVLAVELLARHPEGMTRHPRRVGMNGGVKRWPDRSLAERFWSKVDRRGDAECWPWLASLNLGYGTFGLSATEGTAWAHRVSWGLTHGPIPRDLTVDHLCFNRRCQNPAHMEIVTRAENGRRGSERSHHDHGLQRGSANPHAKLSESAVLAIRASYRAGESMAAIASRIGLSETSTSYALRGLTWSHVPGAIAPHERHVRGPRRVDTGTQIGLALA